MGSSNPKFLQDKFHQILRLQSNPLGLSTLSFRPTGVTESPVSLLGTLILWVFVRTRPHDCQGSLPLSHWAGSSWPSQSGEAAGPSKPRRKQPCFWACGRSNSPVVIPETPFQGHSSLSLKNSARSQLNSSMIHSWRIHQPSFTPPSFLCPFSSN